DLERAPGGTGDPPLSPVCCTTTTTGPPRTTKRIRPPTSCTISGWLKNQRTSRRRRPGGRGGSSSGTEAAHDTARAYCLAFPKVKSTGSTHPRGHWVLKPSGPYSWVLRGRGVCHGCYRVLQRRLLVRRATDPRPARFGPCPSRRCARVLTLTVRR